MPTTRKGKRRHQQQEEEKKHEGDVTLTGEKSNSDGNSVVEHAAADKAPAQPHGFTLPTEQFLSSMLETITMAHAHANKTLISAFLAAPRRDQHSGASSPSAPTAASLLFANSDSVSSSP